MRLSISCLLLLFLISGGLMAQEFRLPTPVDVTGEYPQGFTPGKSVACGDAGDLTGFEIVTMASNSFDGAPMTNGIIPYDQNPADTIFLCYQDGFLVDIVPGSFDLSNDPETGTPAGIGYAIYECENILDINTLDELEADPCLANSGLFPFNDLTVYVASEANWNAGNYEQFIGNGGDIDAGGTIMARFPNGAGEPSPTVLTFAPVTVDQRRSSDGIAVWEDNGPCVAVSVDQAFTVAFLNPIQAAGAGPLTADGCRGSFRVIGGAPELSGSVGEYQITITESTTGASAQITNDAAGRGFRHGDFVEYVVPSAGQYVINIEDGKSCGIFTGLSGMDNVVTHTGNCALPPAFDLSCVTTPPGSSACIEVTSTGFTGVTGFEFSFNYDAGLIDAAVPLVADGALTGVIGNVSAAGTITLTYTSAAANGENVNDGDVLFEICFDVDAGVPNFSESPINIDNGRSREIITSDASGTLTQVEDEDFVIVTCPFSIISTQLDFTTTTTRITCPGDMDGTISVKPAGGTGPYVIEVRNIADGTVTTRNVNNALDSVIITGLDATDYEVTVIDGNGTGTTVGPRFVQVPGPSGPTGIDPMLTPITCSGRMDAVIIASAFLNGDQVFDFAAVNYSIEWRLLGDPTIISTDDTLRNLGPGTYELTLVDNDTGCRFPGSGTPVADPAQLRINVVDSQGSIGTATCDGQSDGSLTVFAGGGTPFAGNEYDFDWSDGFSERSTTSARVNSLLPGDYDITVTDANGCDAEFSFNVPANKNLVINADAPVNVTCFDDGDGSFSGNVTALGAGFDPTVDLPFTVSVIRASNAALVDQQSIATAGGLFQFNNLDTGVFLLQLEDQQGCFAVDTFAISQPDELLITNEMARGESCSPGGDGSFTFDVGGGTFPLVDYELIYRDPNGNPPVVTTPTGSPIENLIEGDYFLTVTDRNSCTDTISFVIAGQIRPILDTVATSVVSCVNATDGQLSVSFDDQGLTITDISWFTVNTDGSQGSLVAGGSLPLAFTTGQNLGPGVYRVVVTADNQCSSETDAIVANPEPLLIAIDTLILPTCPGLADGIVVFEPTGGTQPYSYRLSTDPNGVFVSDPVFQQLPADDYFVEVTDANGCSVDRLNFTIDEPPAITGNFSSLTPVSCPDDDTANGSATFLAAFDDNTTGTFVYEWRQNGNLLAATGPTVTGLNRGPITVNVVDTDKGCRSETFVDTIRSPEPFVVTPTITPVTCFGLTDGEVVLAITGGTPDYRYNWSTGSTTNSISGVTSGVYTVDVTDTLGCVVPVPDITVTEPDELTLDILTAETTPTVRCAGDRNGSIAVFISSINNNDPGPTPYTWSANIDPANIDFNAAMNLEPGTYSVSITDTKGCTDSLTYTIDSPEPLSFGIAPIDDPLCNGGLTPVSIVNPMGGASRGPEDFTFVVNNDGFQIPFGQTGSTFAGDVVVTLFDTIGCSVSDTVFGIQEPPPIIIDLEDEIIVELGDSTVQLDPIISPAGDVYTYSWTPPQFLNNDTIRNPVVFPLENENLVLTVVNANGCTQTEDVFIEVDANRNVFIPNVFSPNRDGRNDDFRIFACRGVEQVNFVRIFDRWGGLVFEESIMPPNCLDGIKLWDGVGQNGDTVNPGVFVYTMEVTFLDGITLLYRGDVTVLR